MSRPKSPSPKRATSIRLDADLVAAMRATGDGWQTRANAALRSAFMGPPTSLRWTPEDAVAIKRLTPEKPVPAMKTVYSVGEARTLSAGKACPKPGAK